MGELERGERRLQICIRAANLLRVCLARPKHFDLPYVSISARLLVLQDPDLDVHRLDRGPISVVQREDVPAERLNELYHFQLLQLVEAVRDPDRDLLGCVALVRLEV